MKTYRLLKDLPGIRAGEVFGHNESNVAKDSFGNPIGVVVMYNEMEKYPDWFEEVKEDEGEFEHDIDSCIKILELIDQNPENHDVYDEIMYGGHGFDVEEISELLYRMRCIKICPSCQKPWKEHECPNTTKKAEGIKLSPCCKSPAWHPITTSKDNWKSTVCRCDICDGEFGYVELIKIVEGLNPVLFWCDKCRTTETEEAKKKVNVMEINNIKSESEEGFFTMIDEPISGIFITEGNRVELRCDGKARSLSKEKMIRLRDELTRCLKEFDTYLNGNMVDDHLPDASKMILTETFTVGDRTYELVPFLKDGEGSITGEEMLKRAKELGAECGEEDGKYILERQKEMPESMTKYVLVFSFWYYYPHAGSCNVACLRLSDKGWYQYWDWLGRMWYNNCRLVRRVK